MGESDKLSKIVADLHGVMNDFVSHLSSIENRLKKVEDRLAWPVIVVLFQLFVDLI